MCHILANFLLAAALVSNLSFSHLRFLSGAVTQRQTRLKLQRKASITSRTRSECRYGLTSKAAETIIAPSATRTHSCTHTHTHTHTHRMDLIIVDTSGRHKQEAALFDEMQQVRCPKHAPINSASVAISCFQITARSISTTVHGCFSLPTLPSMHVLLADRERDSA